MMDIPSESDVKKFFLESTRKDCLKNNDILNIKKLTGDASIRSYFRITSKEGPFIVSGGNPGFLKDTNENFLEVQEVFHENGVRVPKVKSSNVENGFIIQEDLGDKTFLRQVQNQKDENDELNNYKRAIDQMVLIHKIDVSKYPEKCFSKRSFDTEKLSFEVNLATDNFLKKYLRYDLNGKEIKILENSLQYLISKLIKGPFVLCHRDYHSRNIMIKDGEQVVIDFQDARMGLPQYDLVSLLEDCYYKVSSSNKKLLQEYYFEEFISLSKLQTRETFDEYYSLMAIQRIYKAIGSFTFLNFEKKDPRYLRYIGQAFDSLINISEKIEELSDLKKLWEKIYYES